MCLLYLNSLLVSYSLANATPNDAALSALLQSLASCPLLAVCDLSNVPLRDESALKLAALLRSTRSLHSLTIGRGNASASPKTQVVGVPMRMSPIRNDLHAL